MKIAFLCASLSVAFSTVAQAQVHCTATVSKRISIKAPAVLTGTLEDGKENSVAKRTVVLTSLDKNASKVHQYALIDPRGTFHFDSVPAGKYAIAIDFSGWKMEKAEVHCVATNSCSVALVVRPVSPHDCYNSKSDSDLYGNGDGSVIRQ